MTILVPLNTFDNVREVRSGSRLALERDKVTSAAITLAVHLLIAAAALTVIHVSIPHRTQELSVRIMPAHPRSVEEIKPLKQLTIPSVVAAPMPDIVIQTVAPAPVVSAPPSVAATVAAPADTLSGKGTGEIRDMFLERLLAQLNRFKQYPRAAARAHIEGVVMLHFVMNAQGMVLRAEIAKSSGRPVLDKEVLALIGRAQPLPALPADFPTPTLDAVVPIEFSLRD